MLSASLNEQGRKPHLAHPLANPNTRPRSASSDSVVSAAGVREKYPHASAAFSNPSAVSNRKTPVTARAAKAFRQIQRNTAQKPLQLRREIAALRIAPKNDKLARDPSVVGGYQTASKEIERQLQICLRPE
jgi:hypothetical protein